MSFADQSSHMSNCVKFTITVVVCANVTFDLTHEKDVMNEISQGLKLRWAAEGNIPYITTTACLFIRFNLYWDNALWYYLSVNVFRYMVQQWPTIWSIIFVKHYLQTYDFHTGLFYWHGFTSIPASIGDLMPSKVWDEITHPFPSFKGYTVEVWELTSNFIPHFKMDKYIYLCWD